MPHSPAVQVGHHTGRKFRTPRADGQRIAKVLPLGHKYIYCILHPARGAHVRLAVGRPPFQALGDFLLGRQLIQPGQQMVVAIYHLAKQK